MSMDDSKPGGLFSKVVRFVRNPAVHWSELASQADDALGQADRQVLRQTLERKRRNDLVRRREFDQLRKLRRNEAQSAKTPEAQGEGPGPSTHLQGGLIPPDARAATLQKIDAIEEQMAGQWWRNKQPADASTLPMHLLPSTVHVASAAHRSYDADSSPGFAPTAPLDWLVVAGGGLEPAPPGRPGPSPGAGSRDRRDPCDPCEAQTQLHPPAPVPVAAAQPLFVHDPDFEAAAIAFVNGDAPGAEALLAQLLVQRAQQPAMQLPVWLALFDLYRAADLAERFAMRAIDFAARFGRAAPPWFALSAQCGPGRGVGAGLGGCIESDATPWLAALEAQTLAGRPLVVDCSALIRLDFAAAGTVLNWSARMQARGVELRFERLHQLMAVFFGMVGLGDHARLFPRTD